jgi:hypothetical protein
MAMTESDFLKLKINRLAPKNLGFIDKPMMPWLLSINSFPDVLSLQSCSGYHEGVEGGPHLWLCFQRDPDDIDTSGLFFDHEWLFGREDFPVLEITWESEQTDQVLKSIWLWLCGEFE